MLENRGSFNELSLCASTTPTEKQAAPQVRAVGVCNYNAGQVEEMHGLLARHNIPLASNQVGSCSSAPLPLPRQSA